MAGWYEISRSQDDGLRFVLKAGNAETLLTSETYKSRSALANGIASVRRNCVLDERYDVRVAANGQPYFNLKAGNHQVIGSSQRYASGSSCDAGIVSVKINGPTMTIRDRT